MAGSLADGTLERPAVAVQPAGRRDREADQREREPVHQMSVGQCADRQYGEQREQTQRVHGAKHAIGLAEREHLRRRKQDQSAGDRDEPCRHQQVGQHDCKGPARSLEIIGRESGRLVGRSWSVRMTLSKRRNNSTRAA